MKLKKIIPLLILITVLFVSLSAISAESIPDETVISEPVNQIDDAILTDSESTVDYYVSPEGSDDNNGTLDSPYKTIEKAVKIPIVATVLELIFSFLPYFKGMMKRPSPGYNSNVYVPSLFRGTTYSSPKRYIKSPFASLN